MQLCYRGSAFLFRQSSPFYTTNTYSGMNIYKDAEATEILSGLSTVNLVSHFQTTMPKETPQAAPVFIPPTYAQTPPDPFPTSAYGDVTWHTLISSPQTPSTDLSAGIATCPPATGHLCAHRHAQAEVYHILHGEGEVTIDGVRSTVSAGSTVFIPSNAEHGIVNTGPTALRWFYVFPTGSFGDVVYRFTRDEAGKVKL